MADNTTADVTRHWDQTAKEMMGLLRVGTKTYRFLGACAVPPLLTPTVPGPADKYPGHNVAPGTCDILHKTGMNSDQCNEACYGNADCQAYVLNGAGICYLKSCAMPRPLAEDSASGVITGTRPVPPPPPTYCSSSAVEPLVQTAVTVLPTVTEFTLSDAAGSFSLRLRFVSSMFATDYARLSRPVYTLELAIDNVPAGQAATAYFDMSAQHVVNEDSEPVGFCDTLAAAAHPPPHLVSSDCSILSALPRPRTGRLVGFHGRRREGCQDRDDRAVRALHQRRQDQHQLGHTNPQNRSAASLNLLLF